MEVYWPDKQQDPENNGEDNVFVIQLSVEYEEFPGADGSAAGRILHLLRRFIDAGQWTEIGDTYF